MEVTRREIIVSISIIAFMTIIGLCIYNKMFNNHLDEVEKYNKAVKIENTDLFQYAMETNLGNGLVYGKLVSIDPVSFDNVKGKYMTAKRVKERYTKHIKTVRHRDSKGHTYTTEEVYYSWDTVSTEYKQVSEIMFCDIKFDFNKLNYSPTKKYIKTERVSPTIRYVYYGSDRKTKGTLFANLKDETIQNAEFYNQKTINQTLSYVRQNRLWVFWLFWIPITVGLVWLFYYAENEWLY